jgi:redox-sensitive bicupin YhaK (pirin superfamily)
VHRVFSSRTILDLDPFLLLDELGPMNLSPGESKGFPDHPHRGFETVTYILDGKFEHRDSYGNKSQLLPGDVQWMTAGARLIHSERPEQEFARPGGRLHGIQLWVNLLRENKMIKPRYQEISSSKIPIAKSLSNEGVRVKVIAGESIGTRAIIDTKTPIMYLHFILKSGDELVQHVPANFNTFAYIINGEGLFGKNNSLAQKGQMVISGNDGDQVVFKKRVDSKDASEKPDLDLLLRAGQPLNELVARYGPFVMNDQSRDQPRYRRLQIW